MNPTETLVDHRMGAITTENVDCDDPFALQEVFENQRSGLVGKFSTKWLMLTERGPWSTLDGKSLPPKQDIPPSPHYYCSGEWKIDFGRNVDSEGWEYAVNWNASSWVAEKKAFTYVRRRRWFREQRKISKSDSASHYLLTVISPVHRSGGGVEALDISLPFSDELSSINQTQLSFTLPFQEDPKSSTESPQAPAGILRRSQSEDLDRKHARLKTYYECLSQRYIRRSSSATALHHLLNSGRKNPEDNSRSKVKYLNLGLLRDSDDISQSILNMDSGPSLDSSFEVSEATSLYKNSAISAKELGNSSNGVRKFSRCSSSSKNSPHPLEPSKTWHNDVVPNRKEQKAENPIKKPLFRSRATSLNSSCALSPSTEEDGRRRLIESSFSSPGPASLLTTDGGILEELSGLKVSNSRQACMNEEKSLQEYQAKIERVQQKYFDIKEELNDRKIHFNNEKRRLAAIINQKGEEVEEAKRLLEEAQRLILQKDHELSSLRAHYSVLRKKNSLSETSTQESFVTADEPAETQPLPSDEVVVTVYENQRSLLFGGFSVKYLIPKMDSRGEWSDEDGTPSRPPEEITLPDETWSWVTEWDLMLGSDVDEEGWSYAYSFWNTKWYNTVQKGTFVRRRTWYRVRKRAAPSCRAKEGLAGRASFNSTAESSVHVETQCSQPAHFFSPFYADVWNSLLALLFFLLVSQIYLWVRLGRSIEILDRQSLSGV